MSRPHVKLADATPVEIVDPCGNRFRKVVANASFHANIVEATGHARLQQLEQ